MSLDKMSNVDWYLIDVMNPNNRAFKHFCGLDYRDLGTIDRIQFLNRAVATTIINDRKEFEKAIVKLNKKIKRTHDLASFLGLLVITCLALAAVNWAAVQ